MQRIIVALLLSTLPLSAAWSNKVTVTCGTATGTDQTAFPLVVRLDTSNVGNIIKTIANGGKINNTGTQSGGNPQTMPFDLIVTSDAAGATKIPWEVEFFDGTAGTLILWAKVGTLTSATHAVIYVFLGDAAVNTQQNTGSFSVANVWDANFKAVFHLPAGALSTLRTNDSTVNAVNGTGVNGPASLGAGQIDGAVALTGSSSQYIDAGSSAMPTSPITVSAWINPSSITNATQQQVVSKGYDGSNTQWEMYVAGGANVVRFDTFNGSVIGVASISTISNGNWYHITGVYDGTTYRLYFNGTQNNTAVAAAPTATTNLTEIGAVDAKGVPSNFWNGFIDEVRISNTARSANWIATEYANENAPLTFNSVVATSLTAIHHKVSSQ